MEICHPRHRHQLLFLGDEANYVDKCSICEQRLDGKPFYACVDCKYYYVHKSCAQLPEEIQHHFHPPHPLSLRSGVYFACDSCHKTFRNELRFNCSNCDFDLDVKCALMLDIDKEGKEFIRHFTHQHPLKYYCRICNFFMDVSCWIESAKDAQNSERSCFLCGKQHLDSDSCVDSLYFINQSYIKLPEAIKHEFHCHKPLLLLGARDFACDSCHKWFDNRSHYGCEECNFQMDVKCALMPSIQYEESDESICPAIPRHFNHQHPLQLISEVHDINCSACHTIKLSPIYGCIKCEYFLHESCLELPIQIQHSLHYSHELTIQPLRDNFCQICCRKYNGLAFGCIQCLFFVGIECILELGPTVVHKYHPTVEHKYHHHLLCLIEKSFSDRCNANNAFCKLSEESSEFKLTKSYSLRCIKCDYNLHFLCGPLPCTIKHKSHLHALKLVDSIVEDDSDEYYCDICEEIRNPRLCVYYCEDCTFFAHVHCVIFEIINVFKNFFEKVEFRIVGDLTLEDIINPSHDNLTVELLLDLLMHLDAADMRQLKLYFRGVNLFVRKEDPLEMPQDKSSSEDDAQNIIKELSLYKDDSFFYIDERLHLFKPHTKYHIQPDECKLPVIEVKGYKVTSNFAPLFRALLMKYSDFGRYSRDTKNVKSILLNFLCRIVSDMRRTYIGNITEKQLFTWVYYMKRLEDSGFDLQFLKPFIVRSTRSYFGIQAMKFEDEASGRLDREILKVEKEIFELETKREELKRYQQQHRPGKIAEESNFMKELITEARQLKHKTVGQGIV